MARDTRLRPVSSCLLAKAALATQSADLPRSLWAESLLFNHQSQLFLKTRKISREVETSFNSDNLI